MIKPGNNNTVVLFFFFIFAFVLAELSVASIKDGEGMVYEGSTATIALADTYKRTLRRATSVTYSWSSENTSYFVVASSTQYYAVIRGIRPTASCKLFFKCSYYIDGYYRTMDIYYDITVKASSINVTNVSVSQAAAEIEVGGTLQLTASVYPTNATNRNVNWRSNDNNVATVSSKGLVTAMSAGKATITCIAADGSGCRDYCLVTVLPEASGIFYVEKEPAGFRIVGNAVIFEKETLVGVYRIDGSTVFSGKTLRVDGLGKGLYVIRVDGKYRKVMIR